MGTNRFSLCTVSQNISHLKAADFSSDEDEESQLYFVYCKILKRWQRENQAFSGGLSPSCLTLMKATLAFQLGTVNEAVPFVVRV
jgi:hypothetical protein